ncbi:MAG: prephenate/arogenate dehydrogenase family protein [Rhodothalassiaceae bacterium]
MRIGIIGFGLMGASLALALRKADPGHGFIVSDCKPDRLDIARRLLPDAQCNTDARAIAAVSDIVFLATPVLSMGAIAQQIGAHLRPGTILTDLGSVKARVIADVAPSIPEGVHFLPGHPVAGRERAGPEHADPTLFGGRSWILTPVPGTDPSALARLEAVLSSLPLARILRMEAESHDRALAFSSHLPHVIAFAAMLESARLGEQLGIDMRHVNGGSYEDMTRVAAADPVMWRDVFLSNARNIESEIGALISGMESLLASMRAGDGERLLSLLAEARALKTGA